MVSSLLNKVIIKTFAFLPLNEAELILLPIAYRMCVLSFLEQVVGDE